MKRNNKSTFTIFFSLILFMAFLPPSHVDAAMNSYCVTPPFVAQSISPNVLIALDSSGSMNCLAYQNSYDPDQFDSHHYYGYFDPAKNYKYTTSVTPNRWIPTTDAITTGDKTNPIASGNLLNWITMSRQDVAKKILIGGRASSGAYAAADRTTNPVLLYGNSDATTSLTCATNKKSYDSSTTNLISFTNEYDYTVQTGQDNTFTVTYSGPAIVPVQLYPIKNYPGSNPIYTFPAAWAPSTGTLANAYQTVDETTANTSDYIVNNTTTEQALFDFEHANVDLLAAAAAGNAISSITVHAYAKKNNTNTKLYLQAVLWSSVVGPDLVQPSGLSALSKNTFNDMPFDYPTNPVTGAAWQWSDFTSTTGLQRLKAFGVKTVGASGANPSTSLYATVSQVYIKINVVTPPDGGPYNIIVDQGATPASGILDTMSSDVRFGLSNYNTYNSTADGGKVVDYIDYGSITGIVSSISNMIGSGGTPLAETLYEMMRYFRQDSTNYSSSDYIKGCSGAASGTSTCAAASTPNSNDPYFYNFADASLTDRYVPCAKSFVIFMTDGESYGDQNMPGTVTSAPYSACTLTNIKACSGRLCDSKTGACTTVSPRYGGTTVGQTYPNSGTDYMIDVAYWAHTNDMRPGAETDVPTKWRQSIPGKQTVSLYTVYLFGSGSTLLKDAAIYGGFNDINENNRPDCTTTPAECFKDSNGDGVISSNGTDDPITYYEGEDGYKLEASITNAIMDILKRVSSGTAASVLASGEGSGANLVQAVFYPRRKFGNDEINWIGRLTNFWYYVDPNLNHSSIREDAGPIISGSTYALGDKVLSLKTEPTGTNDHIVQFFYDTTNQVTRAHRWNDTNGDSIIDDQLADVDFEAIGNLWEAGGLLWSRPSSSRTIYTQTTGTSLIAFTAANKTTLKTYLTATTDNEAEAIIRYTRGEDTPLSGLTGFSYRPRSVTIGGQGPHIWKLGDVLNSTPKISSWLPLNTYHTLYEDGTYGVPGQSPSLSNAADNSHYITSDSYRARNLIYAGANDGMLHAFKLGTLEYDWDGKGIFDKAKLDGTELGKEVWAFIPKHALPYLKYIADPDYCHVYTVDLTPFIFDASIGGAWDANRTVSDWRTILIGGMRYGGACRNSGTACAGGGTNCVKTPASDVGYSSYFALDITDQNSPTLLWEFANDKLGFSTSGPAVVRAGDDSKNGKWFVILASGPTGPVDTSSKQFLGRSDQQLRIFVLDLRTGSLVRTIENYSGGASLPANAFAGSMVNATLDTDLDYQDDVVYIPYVKDTDGQWRGGGVLRLSLKEDIDPAHWAVSTLIDNAGPVTAAVSKLQNNSVHKLWAIFGTGRYFFKQAAAADDSDGQRRLYSIKDPCFDASGFHSDCVIEQTGTLDNVTSSANSNAPEAANGWYINLDASGFSSGVADSTVLAERVITDPVAATTGLVYFTTFKPFSDPCASVGQTFIWAVKYNTGGDASALLKGQALIQVSTGSIEQLTLSDAFKDSVAGHTTGNRKSAGMQGAPPTAQGLSIISSPAPVTRVLHRRER